MAKPHINDPRGVYKSLPAGTTGTLLVAFGVALLLGLASGIVWILFNVL